MHFATFSHIHILSPAFSNIKHDIIIKQLTSYLLSSLTTSNKRWKRAGSGELPSLIVQKERKKLVLIDALDLHSWHFCKSSQFWQITFWWYIQNSTRSLEIPWDLLWFLEIFRDVMLTMLTLWWDNLKQSETVGDTILKHLEIT